jgi:hypothetical protein
MTCVRVGGICGQWALAMGKCWKPVERGMGMIFIREREMWAMEGCGVGTSVSREGEI